MLEGLGTGFAVESTEVSELNGRNRGHGQKIGATNSLAERFSARGIDSVGPSDLLLIYCFT